MNVCLLLAFCSFFDNYIICLMEFTSKDFLTIKQLFYDIICEILVYWE